MPDVQFNENRPDLYSRPGSSYGGSPTSSGMVGWLVKKGIAKDEKTAQMMLIGVIVVCTGVGIVFFFF